MKNKVNKLYQLCSKLNLYLSLCKVNRNRVVKELADIETLVKDLIEETKK